jgi:hypothetical protein
MAQTGSFISEQSVITPNFCFMNSKAASMICPFGYELLAFDRQNESLFLMGFSIHF